MPLSNGTALLTVVIVTALILLIYTARKSRSLGLTGVVEAAVAGSEFSPTHFEIRDRSTESVCDRLVIVRPFGWTLWAVNDELYVLNPESGTRCPSLSTPAVRVFGDRFVETCLLMPYGSVLSAYSEEKGAVVARVPYSVGGDAFTVLSAINLLGERWITFDPRYTGVGGGSDDASARRTRAARSVAGTRPPSRLGSGTAVRAPHRIVHEECPGEATAASARRDPPDVRTARRGRRIAVTEEELIRMASSKRPNVVSGPGDVRNYSALSDLVSLHLRGRVRTGTGASTARS